MCLLQRAALYFLGGADDREALAYAARMPETGTMSLTVVRFKLRNWVGMGGRDEARDEELLQEFWSRHRDNERGGVRGEDGGGRGGHDVRGPHLSREKDNEEEESDRDGFFRRLLRDSKEEDMELTPSSNGLLKRLFRDKEDRQGEDDEKEGFFRRMFKDKNEERRDSNHARHGNEERLGKSVEDDDREGFFRKIFKDKNEERKDEGHQKPDEREKVGANIEDDKRDGFFKQLFKEKNDEKKEGSTPSKKEEDDKGHKNADDDNFFRRLFKDKNEEKKGIVHDRNEDDKCEEGDKENFFRKLFKDKHEERRTEGPDKNDDYGKGSSGIEEEDNPEFLSFRRLFRVHPEDPKSGHIESSQSNNLSEGSPGSESFFKRLFRDRDRSLEDSEIFGSKMAKEKHPGTTGINEKQSGKPPLPINAVAELRKGSYYASLELVQALCDTSYGLVDIFPIEDRKIALRESLTEINSQIASTEKNGGVCFPMGKGIYRVVHIPEDESVLLNSREKAPYLICVEVLKAEAPSHSKGSSDGHKLSKGGIPLANGRSPPYGELHHSENAAEDALSGSELGAPATTAAAASAA
ncbi:phosphatidylinositol 4-kinase beta 1 [Zea mays]|nr:phosphatidylinositol 4-kinase beta 1 [Zea mays]|eukprot:XP_008666281.2 phosphatidylinositol 4-kinase beta 1 [Zea mays]